MSIVCIFQRPNRISAYFVLQKGVVDFKWGLRLFMWCWAGSLLFPHLSNEGLGQNNIFWNFTELKSQKLDIHYIWLVGAYCRCQINICLIAFCKWPHYFLSRKKIVLHSNSCMFMRHFKTVGVEFRVSYRWSLHFQQYLS